MQRDRLDAGGVHSENKADAAAHYKGGWGFHPMVCSTDAGEPLWGMLRAGNAAANSIDDHVRVLDNAIAALPERDAAGQGVSHVLCKGGGRWSC